jgi:hypothetical protein
MLFAIIFGDPISTNTSEPSNPGLSKYYKMNTRKLQE